MSPDEDEAETAESVLNRLSAGRSLLEVFTPRRETTALLEVIGVVTRSRSIAPTAQDLNEAHGLLDAGRSAREVARRLGVAPHDAPLREPARGRDNGG